MSGTERYSREELEQAVGEALDENPQAAEEAAGEPDEGAGAENYLVGQVMAIAGGRLDPGDARREIRRQVREGES